MDGLAVLRHMRYDKAFRAIAVIILSAEADRGRVVEAIELGISGYVLKAQFSLTDLVQRVKDQFATVSVRGGWRVDDRGINGARISDGGGFRARRPRRQDQEWCRDAGRPSARAEGRAFDPSVG